MLDGLTTWSLGFQETEPGVWKVNRISPDLDAPGDPGSPRRIYRRQTGPNSAVTTGLAFRAPKGVDIAAGVGLHLPPRRNSGGGYRRRP